MNDLIFEMSELDNKLDNFLVFVEKYIDKEYDKYENSVNLLNVFEAAHDEETIDPEMRELFQENENQYSEGFIAKAIKAIKSMIEKFIAWVKERAAAVKNFFTKKETKETLDKIEKHAKEDPEFGKKKVEIIDTEALNDDYQKKIDELEKLDAKLKSNKATEKEYNRFKELSKEINDIKVKKVKKIVVPIAVAVSVIAASVTILTNKANSEKVANPTEYSDNPEDMNRRVVTTSEIIRSKTSGFRAFCDAVMQNINSLKHTIKGERKLDIDSINDVVNPTKESALSDSESTDMINQIIADIEIEEGGNFDSESYLNLIENEIFS